MLTKGLTQPHLLFEASFRCCCSWQRLWGSSAARAATPQAAPAHPHHCTAILKEMRRWKLIHIPVSWGHSERSNNFQAVPWVRFIPPSLACIELLVGVGAVCDSSYGEGSDSKFELPTETSAGCWKHCASAERDRSGEKTGDTGGNSLSGMLLSSWYQGREGVGGCGEAPGFAQNPLCAEAISHCTTAFPFRSYRITE